MALSDQGMSQRTDRFATMDSKCRLDNGHCLCPFKTHTSFVQHHSAVLETYKIPTAQPLEDPSNPTVSPYNHHHSTSNIPITSQNTHQPLPPISKEMGLFTPSTMDAKRQAWTRKRPGQASGSDHPRSPLPRGREPTADYTEEVPIGMSRNRAPSHTHTPTLPPSRRAPAYEEAVPIPPSRHSHTHITPTHPSHANPHSRMSLQQSKSRQESRAVREMISRQDARDIRDELPGLSIHGGLSRGGGSYGDEEGGYVPSRASRGVGRRGSFRELGGRRGERGESRFVSGRGSRR